MRFGSYFLRVCRRLVALTPSLVHIIIVTFSMYHAYLIVSSIVACVVESAPRSRKHVLRTAFTTMQYYRHRRGTTCEDHRSMRRGCASRTMTRYGNHHVDLVNEMIHSYVLQGGLGYRPPAFVTYIQVICPMSVPIPFQSQGCLEVRACPDRASHDPECSKSSERTGIFVEKPPFEGFHDVPAVVCTLAHKIS